VLINRRTFLKTTAATAALLTASPVLDKNSWAAAQSGTPVEIKPTLCNGCSSHCGMWVHTRNNRVWKATGMADHPRSRGKLCARAHGALTWQYDPNRLTVPLKREGNRFVPIGWDQALSEIAAKLKTILDTAGPGTVFYAHNPRETGVFYGQRFMHAIGAPTICTHNAACNTSLTAGFGFAFGSTPGVDTGNAKYILLIGRNYGEGIRTSAATSTMGAIAKGVKVVCVDPRQSATAAIATEWVPIRPGADLALVLAMCNVIITEKLYDEVFIKENTVGFDEFAAAVKEYTPQWAAPITDIPADTITRLARELAAAKPSCFVDPSWKGAFGTNYKNSTITAFAVGCLNGLLGNIGATGGLTFYPSPSFGSLDATKHPAPPRPTIPRADGAGVKGEWPLAPTGPGLPHYLAQKAKEGKVKAAFIRHHNPVRNFPDHRHMLDGFGSLELLVVFDTHLRETGMVAHYVLPETCFLEREEVVEGYPGRRQAVAMRTQVVPKLHPLTRNFDEIISDLAGRLGLGQYFNFTLEELNRARLKKLNISLEELRQKGAMQLPDTIDSPKPKVNFSAAKLKENGFSPVPTWTAPAVQPDPAKPNQFRLIHGKQGYHSHTATIGIPHLNQISRDYQAERIWINAARAKALGIADGDWVVVTSSITRRKVRAKVTERLHPEAAYLPAGYGTFSPYQPEAKGYGISANDLVAYQLEPISGHAMMHEVVVEIRKA